MIMVRDAVRTGVGAARLPISLVGHDLAAGTEITVDYRHLLAPGQSEAFDDAVTKSAIVGFSWPFSV